MERFWTYSEDRDDNVPNELEVFCEEELNSIQSSSKPILSLSTKKNMFKKKKGGKIAIL